MKNYIYGHTSVESAYLVENYPWGWTLKTQQKHWIETNPKLGDRHCTQTLNPKTDKWCAVKKSTYYAVMVLFINEEGHLKSSAIHPSSTKEEVENYMQNIGGTEKLSELQKNQLKRILALNKAMENIKFVCERTPSRTAEEQLAHEAEQKRINQYIAHTANKAYSEITI